MIFCTNAGFYENSLDESASLADWFMALTLLVSVVMYFT